MLLGPSLLVSAILFVIGVAGVLVRRVLTAAGLDPETPGALARFLDIYDRRLLDTTVAYDGVVAVEVARADQVDRVVDEPRTGEPAGEDREKPLERGRRHQLVHAVLAGGMGGVGGIGSISMRLPS